MFRFISAVATVGMLAGLSTAQTITAPEGNWAWQAELDMNGLKLTNEGSRCITEEDSELNISQAVLGIDEACSIFGWNPEGDVTHFALACLGDQAIDMAGVLVTEDDVATLTLKGDVRLGEASPLASTGIITATRTGVCEAVAPVVAEVAEVSESAAEVAETAEASTVSEAAQETAPSELAGGPAEGAGANAATEIAIVEEGVLALPEPVRVAEAPIVNPIPVEEAS